MSGYATGGYIGGPTDDAVAIPIRAGEEYLKADGQVFRFEPCNGGLVLKPTGKRYDMRAVLDTINSLRSA